MRREKPNFGVWENKKYKEMGIPTIRKVWERTENNISRISYMF